jgi:hypothetical protein
MGKGVRLENAMSAVKQILVESGASILYPVAEKGPTGPLFVVGKNEKKCKVIRSVFGMLKSSGEFVESVPCLQVAAGLISDTAMGPVHYQSRRTQHLRPLHRQNGAQTLL